MSKFIRLSAVVILLSIALGCTKANAVRGKEGVSIPQLHGICEKLWITEKTWLENSIYSLNADEIYIVASAGGDLARDYSLSGIFTSSRGSFWVGGNRQTEELDTLQLDRQQFQALKSEFLSVLTSEHKTTKGSSFPAQCDLVLVFKGIGRPNQFRSFDSAHYEFGEVWLKPTSPILEAILDVHETLLQ